MDSAYSQTVMLIRSAISDMTVEPFEHPSFPHEDYLAVLRIGHGDTQKEFYLTTATTMDLMRALRELVPRAFTT